MADAATNDDEDYIRQYGDNPNAPDLTPVNAADRAAPYDATQDFLNAGAISGIPAGAVTPGFGQPGSTDTTDQTNLNVASAMERADLAGRIVQPPPVPSVASTAMDEFGQQRQQIEQQKTQLMAKLGMIPPSAAGLAAVVLPSSQRPRGGGPSDYEKAFEQLNYLNNESRTLHQEQHYSAIENTRQIHEDTARNTHMMVTNGIGKLLNAISDAQQKFPNDYDQQKLYVLHLAKDDPEIHAAGATKTGADIIKPYSDLLHGAAATKQSIQDAIEATEKGSGLKTTSVATTSKGVDVRVGEPKGKAEAEKELGAYGVTQEQVQNPVNARVGTMGVDAKGNQVFTPKYDGDVVELHGKVGQGGKTHIAHIPIATYQKYGGKVGAAPAAPAAPTGIQAATNYGQEMGVDTTHIAPPSATTTPAPAATAAPGTANQTAGGANTVTLTTAPPVVTNEAERDAVQGDHYIYNGKLYQKKKK